MRIPLDYYRILGIPLAASEEQLRQAYSDRTLQMPRREYSQAAISSRKQLIEQAYVVLSNPKERKAYDRVYLAQAYDHKSADDVTTATERLSDEDHTDFQSVSIDIPEDQLVGVLLILQELGEYELVLKFGRPYIINKNGVALASSAKILTTERSHSSTVERQDVVLTVALACLELGREEWQQGHYENAATSLETGEELLAREGVFAKVQAEIQADLYRLRPYRILELVALPAETAKREQGLELLQEILEERGGIDGIGNDRSGLNIDDFLRFIQQIRKHLTVAEQHQLFEVESQRPSAVATYLAVYALIARGFAQRQPALIRQAKKMLVFLGKRQDVHLEQSLCALLLGQTEEATRALEMSQEYEALAFIRENSRNSPDLLPGLCLYGERWLQNDVFPHFQDLAGQEASLKDYFAEEQVQSYLENLPTEAENIHEQYLDIQNSLHPNNLKGSYEFPHQKTQNNKSIIDPLPRASRTYQDHHNLNGKPTNIPPPSEKRRTYQRVTQRVSESHPKRRRRTNNTAGIRKRQLRKIFMFLVGILILWFSVTTTISWLKNFFFVPSVTGSHLSVKINQPLVVIPKPDDKFQLPTQPLTMATAEEVIQIWLSVKASAMGPNHDIDSLNQILVNPTLSKWRLIAQQEKAKNLYRKYNHTLKIESLNTSKTDQYQAVVEATVNENTYLYENTQLKQSNQDNFLAQYNLTHVDGSWRIRDMSVIKRH